MSSIWNTLRERAVYVSFAGDAFHFDISWLGVIILIAAVVMWRRLRRRR
jgi:predicted ABC-type sugar transport system permease subunit